MSNEYHFIGWNLYLESVAVYFLSLETNLLFSYSWYYHIFPDYSIFIRDIPDAYKFWNWVISIISAFHDVKWWPDQRPANLQCKTYPLSYYQYASGRNLLKSWILIVFDVILVEDVYIKLPWYDFRSIKNKEIPRLMERFFWIYVCLIFFLMSFHFL